MAKGKDGLLLNALEFLVLAALQPGPAHGYGLVGRIEEQTAGGVRIRPGDLYRVLYRLSKRGLVAPDSSDDRRNFYRLTRQGGDVLEAEAAMLSGVIAWVRRTGRLRTS
ncbi:MAG TPA: helix-turn-helix transcriptional regulator [Vicinamibacteria bacterium]|nr:helix-turn-helix transcriptional regulator [Vicinamibacteria bacterium]